MTLSKIGAAVTLDNIETVFNWLCEQDRPIEIQDFTPPNILSGDLSGLISRYQTGDGVDQDPQKVSFWTDQYQALKKEKDRPIKLAALNKELEANPYFYWLGLFPRAIENSNSSASSTMVTGLPSLTVVDLLSSPSIYSTRRGIQNRIEDLEVHAVRWANPDSMVAQVSQ